MQKISLTAGQKTALESRHKNTRDVRECDRIKAILLASEGWSTSSIAQALRKNEYTISRHLNDYLKKEKLKPENGGSQSFLSGEQSQQLIEHISEHTYAHVLQIVAYVLDRWNIKYTVSGMNKWLHQQRFTYKKPKGVPHKFDIDSQTDFVEHYKTLKAALPDDQHFGQFLEKTDAGDISKNRGTITPISTDTSHGLHIKNCLKRYTQR